MRRVMTGIGGTIMKHTGMTREIDGLGRIVIPKEIRRTFGVNNGDMVEIFYDDRNNAIYLQKYDLQCAICGTENNLVKEIHEKHICQDCISQLI